MRIVNPSLFFVKKSNKSAAHFFLTIVDTSYMFLFVYSGENTVSDYKKDYLVYAYSYEENRWGFQPVFGHEEYLYICEMPIEVGFLCF